MRETLHLVRRGGELLARGLEPAPNCNVVSGAAGVACGLLHMARAAGDDSLMSLADDWVRRAEADADEVAAFRSDELGIHPGTAGETSPYYTLSGVHAVRCLVAAATGERAACAQALRGFVESSRGRPKGIDLTRGRAATLIGCALILDALQDPEVPKLTDEDLAPLVELGDSSAARIWNQLDRLPAIPECVHIRMLGMAHGWAGLCYASMAWARARGRPVPGRLDERLEQLAALADPQPGGGLRWPWSLGGEGHMESWCHGSPGFVHLFTSAYLTLGDPRHLELAERAALTVWAEPRPLGTICCGLAGGAYSLLCLHRVTGERIWRTRAAAVAEQAARAPQAAGEFVHSLYHGRLGVAVLATDLANPSTAAQPFFELRAPTTSNWIAAH